MPPRSGGYAQKTTLVGIAQAITKTRKGIHYYSRTIYNSRKRPPCFLILAGVPAGGAVARTLTPTGARQLIVCTGSIIFKSRG